MATCDPVPAEILSPERLATLRAAMDCILPAGEDGPCATEAGADVYAVASLRQGANRAIGSILEGLDLLASMARDLHGCFFAECDAATREVLFRQVAEIPHRATRRFLGVLVTLTLQGYLCDPKHGGNRDGLGWRHIGFEPDPPPGEGAF